MNLYGGGSWEVVAFRGCPAFHTNTPPCWFWRWTQYVVFGFIWKKVR